MAKNPPNPFFQPRTSQQPGEKAVSAVGGFVNRAFGGGRDASTSNVMPWTQPGWKPPTATGDRRRTGVESFNFAGRDAQSRAAASQRPGTAGSAGLAYGRAAPTASRASTAPLATGSDRLAKVSMRMQPGAPSDRLGSAVAKGASSVSAKRTVDRSTGPSDAITAGIKSADPNNWVGIARSLGNKGDPNFSQWKNKTAPIKPKSAGGQFSGKPQVKRF